jgi:putative transposase
VSAFVDEGRCDFGVELICATLGVSASAYYQRATGERSARAVEDERLLEVIKTAHAANYEAYGSRRMWKALRRQGETAPRCQVERLMAANAIVGAKRRGRPWRTTVQGAAAVASPDLLDRDFSAERPDEKWCADFTYLRCWRASCSSASSSTATRGWSSAGSSPGTCAPSLSRTRWRWPSANAARTPTGC